MVKLTLLTSDDFPSAGRWLSAGSINRWLTSAWRGRSIDGSVLAMVVRNKCNRLYLVWHETRPCGIVGFADLDMVDRTGMIWYLMGEAEVGGRGVITQAVAQAVAVGFAELGLESIYAWIMEDNTASRRVLEKNSFREAGRIRMGARSGENQVARVYFDLVRADLGMDRPQHDIPSTES